MSVENFVYKIVPKQKLTNLDRHVKIVVVFFVLKTVSFIFRNTYVITLCLQPNQFHIVSKLDRRFDLLRLYLPKCRRKPSEVRLCTHIASPVIVSWDVAQYTEFLELSMTSQRGLFGANF